MVRAMDGAGFELYVDYNGQLDGQNVLVLGLYM